MHFCSNFIEVTRPSCTSLTAFLLCFVAHFTFSISEAVVSKVVYELSPDG